MVLPMIHIKHSDILVADVDAVVNTVNCVGVMGKGIALQFKMKYPDNYKFYKKVCDQGKMVIGKILTYELKTSGHPKYIFNFPTKRHWKTKSNIEDIKSGLASLIAEVNRLKIKSIAIPALGSGQGGLNWQQVKPIIIDAFSHLPEIDVQLYEPDFTVKSIVVNTKKPNMTLTKALLIKLLQTYQVLGYPHSLLEIQKLLYFMNIVLNDELKFKFNKFQYGPYTDKINYLLQNMEAHYIHGYGDRSQKAEIRLVENAINEANNFLANRDDCFDKLEKIKRLIDGFETPFGMELLASVHWVIARENISANSLDAVTTKIHQWNERKKYLFQPYHINIALQRLKNEHWF